MRLLVEPSRDLPLVFMCVAFGTGGAHDPAGREGLGSIVGRMLRRGAEGMKGEAIEERVDSLGGEFGVSVGLGSSSVGAEAVARSAPELAALVGKVIATPVFEDDELEKLKRQVEAELVAARDDDSTLASRALRRNLFAGHPHGRRVSGSIASVRSIGREDVVRAYRRGFTQDNAIVAVGGDVDDALAEELARLLLAGLPRGEALPYPAREPEPTLGRRLVVVDKPERSQVKLGIGLLGTHPHDEDHLALLVGNTAFGGTFTSRLMQEIRSKRGWSYGASASLSTSRVREAFTMWTAPAEKDAAACLALELELLEAWQRHGVTEEEASFAREYLCRSYAFEVDTAKKRLNQTLERELLKLPADYHARYVERVSRITRGECNEAIARRIEPSRAWVAAVATDAEVGAELRSAVRWDATSVARFDAE